VTVVGLQPQPDADLDSGGRFLTFVVPPTDGCNLHCSFCLIRRRWDVAGDPLRPGDLARFIGEERAVANLCGLNSRLRAAASGVVTLHAGCVGNRKVLGLPTALVANRVLLANATDLLTALVPSKIAISLDAASDTIHDRIRGVAGAWAASVAGIKLAIKVLTPQTKLVVSSVLLPGKRCYVDGMPARLSEIGIDRWIVNPLLRVGADHVGGPVGDRASLFHDLLILQEAADRAGGRLNADDEFDHFGHESASIRNSALRSLRLRTLPRNVKMFLLTPERSVLDRRTLASVFRQEMPRYKLSDPGCACTAAWVQERRIEQWGLFQASNSTPLKKQHYTTFFRRM
jgi:hypothetical protein